MFVSQWFPWLHRHVLELLCPHCFLIFCEYCFKLPEIVVVDRHRIGQDDFLVILEGNKRCENYPQRQTGRFLYLHCVQTTTVIFETGDDLLCG